MEAQKLSFWTITVKAKRCHSVGGEVVEAILAGSFLLIRILTALGLPLTVILNWLSAIWSVLTWLPVNTPA